MAEANRLALIVTGSWPSAKGSPCRLPGRALPLRSSAACAAAAVDRRPLGQQDPVVRAAARANALTAQSTPTACRLRTQGAVSGGTDPALATGVESWRAPAIRPARCPSKGRTMAGAIAGPRPEFPLGNGVGQAPQGATRFLRASESRPRRSSCAPLSRWIYEGGSFLRSTASSCMGTRSS